MKKHILTLIGLFVLFTVMSATAVFAQYIYRASYTISENGTASYDMLPVWEASNNQWMIDNGFIIDADALDTRIETLGGLVRPHMITDNMTLTAVAVPLASQTNLYFTTGNSLLTKFPIIAGWGGYVVTADNESIELYDHFAVQYDGWIDTTRVSDNIAVKLQAWQMWISASGNISVGIPASRGYITGDDTQVNVGGVDWFAQTFTTGIGGGTITSINLRFLRIGNPGIVTVGIRNTAAGKPTGGDLTSGTIDGDTFTEAAGGEWYYFDLTDYILSASTMYGIVVRAPGGGAGNRAQWRYDNADATYGGGTFLFDGNDSGATWTITAASDFVFETIIGTTPLATVSNVTSGNHVVTGSANLTHLIVDVDGTKDIAILSANITDNGENWQLLSNATPYTDNISISINGTQELLYEPDTYILSSNLPDLTLDSQNGTFIWGTNPTNIAVALGSMVSSSQPTPGQAISTPTQDILPEVEVTDWFLPPDISGALLTNPMRPFVTLLSDTTTLTEIQSWRLLAFAFVLLATLSTARGVRGHHLITGIACGASWGGMVALTIFPMWSLVFMILPIVAGAIAERSPSL